jgi:hypothetical protein
MDGSSCPALLEYTWMRREGSIFEITVSVPGGVSER